VSPGALLADPFRLIEKDGARIASRLEAVLWAEAAISGHGTLYAAAAASGGSRPMEGRATVYTVPSPVRHEARWAVRHYMRGGMMRPLGDRFLRALKPRPFRELAASETLRSRGIRTPRVVAAAVYPAGPLYRADLVTEFVPASEDLVALLFGGEALPPGDSLRLEALEAAGRLVRTLAAAGGLHPDLNAKNVLLTRERGPLRGATGAGALLTHVVDLDRCRATGRAPSDALRSRWTSHMSSRLSRSLRKWEEKTGRKLNPEEHEAFEDAVADPSATTPSTSS
jgi:hypothetical protein